MSLSFVTKAIQTTAADGTYEEKAVETEDDKRSLTRATTGVGLFDQLRHNKEEEEAARLEFQRSIMRGTLALDEDDVAHLQQLQRQREAEISAQVENTEKQIAAFRAARPILIIEQLTTTDDANNQFENSLDSTKLSNSLVPTIRIKKRRRQENESTSACASETSDDKQNNEAVQVLAVDTKDATRSSENNTNNVTNGGLSSLLSGYSSDENE
jgi:FAM192A/Fyv6, N-terminal domain